MEHYFWGTLKKFKTKKHVRASTSKYILNKPVEFYLDNLPDKENLHLFYPNFFLQLQLKCSKSRRSFKFLLNPYLSYIRNYSKIVI